jgi:hypothetical protein
MGADGRQPTTAIPAHPALHAPVINTDHGCHLADTPLTTPQEPERLQARS